MSTQTWVRAGAGKAVCALGRCDAVRPGAVIAVKWVSNPQSGAARVGTSAAIRSLNERLSSAEPGLWNSRWLLDMWSNLSSKRGAAGAFQWKQ